MLKGPIYQNSLSLFHKSWDFSWEDLMAGELKLFEGSFTHDLQLTSLSAGISTGLLAWTPRHWFCLWLFELPHSTVPGFQQRCLKRGRQKLCECLILASEVTACTSALIRSWPNSRGDNTGFTSQREECQNHNEREHLWKTQPATSLLREEGGIPCRVVLLHAFPMAGARAWLFLHIL